MPLNAYLLEVRMHLYQVPKLISLVCHLIHFKIEKINNDGNIFNKENTLLKNQVSKLLQEGDIWKRAFKTLHGQKEEFERSCQELHQLRLLMSQQDEQLRKLKVENYELKLRLVQENPSSSMPGRFHPDVFG